MSKFVRLENMGVVAYTAGSQVLRVPSEKSLRERLIKLLESADGDRQHTIVEDFWRDRAVEMGSNDEMRAAWATEVFEQLNKIWDELTTAPPVADVFADFGL